MADFGNAFGGGSPGKIGRTYVGQYDTFGDLPAAGNYDEGTVAWIRDTNQFYYVSSETWIVLTLGGGGDSLTAAEILGLLTTVDGGGSGLDADRLDGVEGSGYATAAQGSLAASAVQPGDPLTDLSSVSATAGYVPTATGAGGGITWAAQTGGTGGAFTDVVIHTTSSTLAISDINKVHLVGNGAVTITLTLPDLASADYNGSIMRFIVTDTNTKLVLQAGTNVAISPDMGGGTPDTFVVEAKSAAAMVRASQDVVYQYTTSPPRYWHAPQVSSIAPLLDSFSESGGVTVDSSMHGTRLGMLTGGTTVTLPDTIVEGFWMYVSNRSSGTVSFAVSGTGVLRTPASTVLDNAGRTDVDETVALVYTSGSGNWWVWPLGPTIEQLTTAGLNIQTGTTYTLAFSDAGKVATFDNASAITVTIPNEATAGWKDGTVIGLVQEGAGAVSVAAGAGVTLRSKGSVTGINGQWATASLLYLGSDVWLLSGDIA